MTDHEGPEVE